MVGYPCDTSVLRPHRDGSASADRGPVPRRAAGGVAAAGLDERVVDALGLTGEPGSARCARRRRRPSNRSGSSASSLWPCSGHAQGQGSIHVCQLGGGEAGLGRRVPAGDPDAHAADRGGGRLGVDEVERAVLLTDGQDFRTASPRTGGARRLLARRPRVTARASRCWRPRRASGSRCGPGRGRARARRGCRGGRCRCGAARSPGGRGAPRGRLGPVRRGLLLWRGSGRTARRTGRPLRRRCHGSRSRGTRARRTGPALRAGSGPVCHLPQAGAAAPACRNGLCAPEVVHSQESSSFQPVDR